MTKATNNIRVTDEALAKLRSTRLDLESYHDRRITWSQTVEILVDIRNLALVERPRARVKAIRATNAAEYAD